MNKEFPSIKVSAGKVMLKPGTLYFITFGNESYNTKSSQFTHWGNSPVWQSTKESHVERHPVYAYGKHIKIFGNFILIEKGFCSVRIHQEFYMDPEEPHYRRSVFDRIAWQTGTFETFYRVDIQSEFMVGNVSVDIIVVDRKFILSSEWYKKTLDEACSERDAYIEKTQAEYKEKREKIAREAAEAEAKKIFDKEIEEKKKQDALDESKRTQAKIEEAITEPKISVQEPTRKPPFWKRVLFYFKNPNRKCTE